jgi:acylpyruvate hydrolase
MRLSIVSIGGRRVLAARRGEDLVRLDVAAPGLPTELGALLRAGLDAGAIAAAVEAPPREALVDASQALFEPLIADGARILCLGLNYVDHASEAAYAKPDYPVIFTRYASSFVGHERPLMLPSASRRFDYEAELVAVIGRGGRRIPRDQALSHVAGYTLMNDGSVRDYQLHTVQWTLGKNFDASGSVGPELVTADELPAGARGLKIEGRLNGTVMQHASTSDMIFDVATTIAYLSEAIALAPGDLIAMGTPAGVGNARTPPVYLTDGDTFEIEVERVGALRNPVRPETTLPPPTTGALLMTWSVDPVHSHVGFSVRHMMVTTVRGSFKTFSGTLDIDPNDFTRSQIHGEIDVASIDTGNTDRDNHLRAGDFFDAPNHPKITFKSTRIAAKGDGFVVTGDLTIRGVTKSVDIDVEYAGTSKNPYGQIVTGVSGSTTINRKDFGVNFNAVLETGGVAVGEKVKLEIEVQAKQG